MTGIELINAIMNLPLAQQQLPVKIFNSEYADYNDIELSVGRTMGIEREDVIVISEA